MLFVVATAGGASQPAGPRGAATHVPKSDIKRLIKKAEAPKILRPMVLIDARL
jgi:hypothetical protein